MKRSFPLGAALHFNIEKTAVYNKLRFFHRKGLERREVEKWFLMER